MKKYIIIVMSLFLVGCQSYSELNNSAIVSAIGIDMNNNKYKISVQVANTEKSNDEQQNLNNSIVYTSSGRNISEALNNINLKSPNRLYLGHLQLVLISENIAKNKINEITDYFLRSNQINKNFTILLAKDNNPEEILNVPTSLVNFPRGNILGSLEISSTIGVASNNIKFTKFINDLQSEGISPVMSSISIVENTLEDKKDLKISDMGLFKKDKLVGYLNEEETKGYNFITNNINSTIITFKCNDQDNMSVNLKNEKTTMNFKINNNKPQIIIKVKGNSNIEESNCDISLNDIQKKTNKKIKNLINKTITKVKQDYQTDVFGFGNTIYLKNNGYFNKIKKDWDKYFLNLDIKIDVDIDIETKGKLILKEW